MSYNIDTWEQIACTLTFPASVLDGEYDVIDDVEYGKPGASTDVTIRLQSEDGEIIGILAGDTFTVKAMCNRASRSGSSMDDLAELLEQSSGEYQALLVWEGGDSISLFSVTDGVTEDTSIDVPALLRENAELKRQLSAR